MSITTTSAAVVAMLLESYASASVGVTSMTVLSPNEATPMRAAVDGSELTNVVR